MIKLPDVTMIYVVISFVIAYAILKRYLFVPLGAILDERERESREAESIHAETRAKLDAALAQAEESLSEARREALKAREELRAQGHAQLEKRLAEATAAAAASVESASQEIEKRERVLSGQLGEGARGLARTLAEKILGRTLAA
jgi:F-type H+-transporting ATPase subunit b